MMRWRSHGSLIKIGLRMALADLFIIGLLVLVLGGLVGGGRESPSLWWLGAAIVWPALLVTLFLRLPVRWSRFLDFRSVLLVCLATATITG